MRVLLIHQNFPGQFKHLGPALVARGDHVVALTPKVKERSEWRGITVEPYAIKRGNGQNVHPWVMDLETKVIRAEACYQGAVALKQSGFEPDVILTHHGWGESLFLKDVWPNARMGLYCELYHQAGYPFVGFDPEFETGSQATDPMRLRLRNINNDMHFDIADAGLSPTQFQADTFPATFRDKISIIHDGIDTDLVCPNPKAALAVSPDLTLTRNDEVITFINRNLEPYRGYHIFMRALPRMLAERPKAQVVILGGEDVSYGARPPEGKTWKQIFIDEVRGSISDADWARVHFMGRVPYDTFLSMIQVSRVHVYLTYPFVLSWSLLESMSAGAAIVAGSTDPVTEVMDDGKTGLLVNFFDPDEIVDRVNEFMHDTALRQALGQAARREVIENYDLRRICLPRLLDWVDSVAQCSVAPVLGSLR